MNQQELLAASEVMRRAGCGEVVESFPRFCDGGWKLTVPWQISWDWLKFDYRIVDFPPPPSGQSWHNLAGLTTTQVGVHEGWRLVLESELGRIPEGAFPWINYKWSTESVSYGLNELLTFRTKSPLPVANPIVPVQTEESWIEENCRKTFPDSWNMTILQIWEAGYKADKERNNNQKDDNQKYSNPKDKS